MQTMVKEGWRRDIHLRDEVDKISWWSGFEGRGGGRRLE